MKKEGGVDCVGSEQAINAKKETIKTRDNCLIII